MKYFVIALALFAAPASAQTKLDIDLDSFNALVEAAPSVCSKISQMEDGTKILMQFMDHKGFTLAQKYVMVNLCKVYIEGKLEGLRV